MKNTTARVSLASSRAHYSAPWLFKKTYVAVEPFCVSLKRLRKILSTDKQTQAHGQRGCFENSVFLCLSFAQTNPDTNKPIIGLSIPTALPGSEFTSIQMWFLWLCRSFSSTQRNTREPNHNGFARPWEKEHAQTSKKKIAVFLHTSVVPSSPGWRRQEMGMTVSCLSRLWRCATSYGATAEWRSWAFTGLFVMCDLQLPRCLFICDLVLPGRMAISCSTRPLRSCRGPYRKQNVTKKSFQGFRLLHFNDMRWIKNLCKS